MKFAKGFEVSMVIFVTFCAHTLGMFAKLPWLDHINTNERNYGVAVADVNHDGKFDWIVAGYSGNNFILTFDDRTGRLKNLARTGTPYEPLMDPDGNAIGVCACDIDGDGKEEIYFLNTNNAYAGRSSYGDKLFKWRGGTYIDLYADYVNRNILAKGFAGRSVACIDRLGTGRHSIIIATYSRGGTGKFALIEMKADHPENDVQNGLIVLQNVAGEAGIERSTGGRGVTVGPILNNNGRSDIFFVNEGNPWMGNPGDNFLFMNLGNGSFTDVASNADILDSRENGRGVTLGDFNHDGLVDIVYGNWEGSHRFYLQDKNFTDQKSTFRNIATTDFSEPSPIRTVIAADFDNDGFTEIFMNNINGRYSRSQPNKLFKVIPKSDDRDPVISKIDIGDALETYGTGTGGAVADIDSDGYLELLISHGESQAQPLQVYQARKLRSYQFLRVFPTTRYGAPARGASVKIYTIGRNFHHQIIDGGSGYLCQMEPVAHFGLGNDIAVQLIVQWPDGTILKKTLAYKDMNKLHKVPYPRTSRDLPQISRLKRPCKYKGKIAASECVNGFMNITQTRHPKSNPENCPETQNRTVRCRAPFCKYSRRNPTISACSADTNTETVVVNLKKAVGKIVCNATKTYERPCRMIGECLYKDLYEYGDCDSASGRATGSMKLKRGPDSCAATVMVKLSCADAAFRMEKMKAWKAKKQAKKEARKHSKHQRKANKAQRKANKAERKANKAERRANKQERRANRRKACRYSSGPWSQCDQTTDTISKTLTLSRGDPNVCEQVKVMRKKCRKSCKYKAGTWESCDKLTNIRQRVDTLKENSESFCENTRIVTQKCKKNKVNRKDKKVKKKQRKQRRRRNQKCVYDKGGDWSHCNETTNKRTKTKLLKTGDPEKCPPQREIQKSCVRPNGEERCFFGKWMEWGDCMNGVRTKRRIVQHGGDACQRKAVQTKAC